MLFLVVGKKSYLSVTEGACREDVKLGCALGNFNFLLARNHNVVFVINARHSESDSANGSAVFQKLVGQGASASLKNNVDLVFIVGYALCIEGYIKLFKGFLCVVFLAGKPDFKGFNLIGLQREDKAVFISFSLFDEFLTAEGFACFFNICKEAYRSVFNLL